MSQEVMSHAQTETISAKLPVRNAPSSPDWRSARSSTGGNSRQGTPPVVASSSDGHRLRHQQQPQGNREGSSRFRSQQKQDAPRSRERHQSRGAPTRSRGSGHHESANGLPAHLGNGPFSLMKRERESNHPPSALCGVNTPSVPLSDQNPQQKQKEIHLPFATSKSADATDSVDASPVAPTIQAESAGTTIAKGAGVISLSADARAALDQPAKQTTKRSDRGSRGGKPSQRGHHQSSAHNLHRPQDRADRSDRGSDRPGRSEARSVEGHPQLFDPKRHNALSFAKGLTTNSTLEGRSSLAASTTMTSAPSIGSSEGRDRRRRRGAASAASEASSKNDDDNDSTGPGSHSSSRTRESNAHVVELKRIYRDICAMESKLKDEHRALRGDRTGGQASLSKGEGLCKPTGRLADDSLDHGFWLSLMEQHKRLIDLDTVFLDLAFRVGMPASVRSLPQDYDIIVRLWQNGCHLMLESLRHNLPFTRISDDLKISEPTRRVQAGLLDHLTDFIHATYTVYSSLLEAEHLQELKACWLESLGDLARYRMLIAGLTANNGLSAPEVRNKARRESRWGRGNEEITTKHAAGTEGAESDTLPSHLGEQNTGEGPDQPLDQASVGSAALGDWELEEQDTWRLTAKEWYAKALEEVPGTGRLHHHLAVLSRDNDLEALDHFCKSLTCTHSYASGKESILPLFDHAHQQRRARDGATLIDLFLHIHGMLFTRIELDNFDRVMHRFLHDMQSMLDSDGWEASLGFETLSMMASINMAAMMQYGASEALLGTVGVDGLNTSKSSGKKHETAGEPAEIASSRTLTTSPLAHKRGDLAADDGDAENVSCAPIVLQHALRFTFRIMTLLLSGSGATVANPYVTMLLTFLFRLVNTASGGEDSTDRLRVVERFVPWQPLALLAAMVTDTVAIPAAPQKIGGSSPLPEDSYLRGLSWAGRKVFEKDFWKQSVTHDGASTVTSRSPVDNKTIHHKRLQRLAIGIGALAAAVPGFDRSSEAGVTLIHVKAPLAERDARWKREEDERDATVVSHEQAFSGSRSVNNDSASSQGMLTTDEDDDDEQENTLPGDPPALQELKARRRALRAMLTKAQEKTEAFSKSGAGHPQHKNDKRARSAPRPRAVARVKLDVLPGYTVLVLDTNVALAENGCLVQRLIDSQRWTVIVPLAVITELDGLKQNLDAVVSENAIIALSFLESAVKTKSRWLKVQTSKGNYLSGLECRTEDIDFSGSASTSLSPDSKDAPREGDRAHGAAVQSSSSSARNLDEVILRCYTWQVEHFADRLAILTEDPSAERAKITADTQKVVLATLDRSLRLRVRARGGAVAGPAELAEILLLSSE